MVNYKQTKSLFSRAVLIVISLCSLFVGVVLENKLLIIERIITIFSHNEVSNYDSFSSAYYKDQVSIFNSYNQKHVDIVFIGDSLIDNADWYLYFPQQTVVNLGIQGERVYSLGNRIQQVAEFHPSNIVILVGINDILLGRTIDEIYDDYIELLLALEALSNEVFVLSLIKPSHKIDIDFSQIDDLNWKLNTFSVQHNKIQFIDINSSLTDGNYMLSKFSTDGIHLNAEAYNKIVLELRLALSSLSGLHSED